ncbi:MAG: hypothetical protein GX442_17475 [Candidatus Riflebacteria bacterium]|nr:hypothetical protein [Candidatus Riflebacteria bacterium]
MEKASRADLEAWVAQWRAVGPELALLRRQQLAIFDLHETIDGFNDAFAAAVSQCPPGLDSGLVEQQRVFSRWNP